MYVETLHSHRALSNWSEDMVKVGNRALGLAVGVVYFGKSQV